MSGGKLHYVTYIDSLNIAVDARGDHVANRLAHDLQDDFLQKNPITMSAI